MSILWICLLLLPALANGLSVEPVYGPCGDDKFLCGGVCLPANTICEPDARFMEFAPCPWPLVRCHDRCIDPIFGTCL
ncbi:unnamed protein product, partial [Mesorhabditis spiculigera]